jgi:hypothetical protein
VSRRFWNSALSLLLAGAAGSAAAQDYTAGKTPAQLFQSDCSACHKSPQGLARSADQRALGNFLREHYTTKAESAGALAAYVLSAGVGAGAGQKPPAAGPVVPRPGVGIVEGEPGQRPRSRANATTEPRPGEGDSVRPAPRPRVVTAPAGPAAEPAQPPDDEGEPSIIRDDLPKRAPRTPLRDGAKPADATAIKLRSYGAAGGSAKETERLADPAKAIGTKVESYATSGSPAPAATPEGPKDAAPGETGGANAATVPAADAATPPPKRKRSDRRRDAARTAGGAADTTATTAGTSAPHSPRRPQRAQGPAVQPPRGNN